MVTRKATQAAEAAVRRAAKGEPKHVFVYLANLKAAVDGGRVKGKLRKHVKGILGYAYDDEFNHFLADIPNDHVFDLSEAQVVGAVVQATKGA